MTEAQRENPSRRLRVFTQSPAEFFDEGLRQIEKTRMAGLPILNPKLVVRSAGWRRWGNDWIGVVTTPMSFFVFESSIFLFRKVKLWYTKVQKRQKQIIS